MKTFVVLTLLVASVNVGDAFITSICPRAMITWKPMKDVEVRSPRMAMVADVEGDNEEKPIMMAEDNAEAEEKEDEGEKDVLLDLETLDDMLGEEVEEDKGPRQKELNTAAIQSSIKRWQIHEKDTGSANAQVAILTEKISYMTRHLKEHPKDSHSKRGLVAMVSKRKKLLNYIYFKDVNQYEQLIQGLGIRFRPKERYQTRADKYASFKNTKRGRRI